MVTIRQILPTFLHFVFLILANVSCSTNQTSELSLPQLKGEDLRNGDAAEFNIGSSKKPTAIIFLSAKCPCSNSHIDRIINLANQYTSIQFIGIHSNQDEPLESARTYFKSLGLPFPVMRDENAVIADFLKAFKTPHAYLLDPQNQIVYQGGVTDCPEANKSEQQYLKDALEDLINNRPIKNSQGRTLGCFIKRTP